MRDWGPKRDMYLVLQGQCIDGGGCFKEAINPSNIANLGETALVRPCRRAIIINNKIFFGGLSTLWRDMSRGVLVLFITYFMRPAVRVSSFRPDGRSMAEFWLSVLKRVKIMESGFALGKWQFMINGQIHAQLGAIAYLQREQARHHLSQTWK